jgi:hypothetical protein
VPARAAIVKRPLSTGAYGPEEGLAGQFTWTREEANFYLPTAGKYLVLKLAAPQPDVTQRAVQLTVSTPCGNLLDVALTSPEPLTLGLQVPEGLDTVHLIVKVSRTFRPSDLGGDDRRTLGATVASEFTDSGDRFRDQERTAVLPLRCPASPASS